MASRRIADLHPDLQPLALEFVSIAAEKGVDVLIYCTYRSNEEQAREYARGRTISSEIDVKPWRPLGKTVTNAKAGQSAHNFTINGKPASRAYDCVPIVNGKADWSGKSQAWKIIGKIGMDLGLNWYGAPNSKFYELFHFQLRS
jgi:peptidoglycan L-alanyl-D-glutamate endopeptidase CwlK